MKTNIYLLGVDARHPSRHLAELLKSCRAVVASRRILATVEVTAPLVGGLLHIPITPLDECFDRVDDELSQGNVAILATGDPLFFGIGRRCIERFGNGVVRVYPALSSVQYAFAGFGIPWEDARCISLHGRRHTTWLAQLLAHDKVAILTDGDRRPELICQEMLTFLGTVRSSRYRVFVAENIGMEGERFVSGSLDEIGHLSFGAMCCMLVTRSRSRLLDDGGLGLTEEQIQHSRGLITKNEVRGAALHALDLRSGHILWDVGAGSGSVGLEAARMVRECLVYCIEKEPEQHANISANIERYGMDTMKLIQGEAPKALAMLPTPDRIFVGGSGGNLHAILDYCAVRLPPHGRIVVTAVLEKTAREAPVVLHPAGLEVSMSIISVSRSSYPQTIEKTFNPITIISGKRI